MSVKSAGSAAARPSSRAAAGSSAVSRWLGALLPLALSAALLMLGLPRLVGAVATLPFEPQVEALKSGRDLTHSELSRLDSRWSIARRFTSSGEISAELAAIKMATADQLPERATTERRDLIGSAAELLRESLSEGPANAFAWARYAAALSEEGRPEAIDAWRMSVLTSPADRRLLLWRSQFALARVAQLAQIDRDLLDSQIRLAWRHDRDALLRFARRAKPAAVQILRAALVQRPEDAASFEQALR